MTPGKARVTVLLDRNIIAILGEQARATGRPFQDRPQPDAPGVPPRTTVGVHVKPPVDGDAATRNGFSPGPSAPGPASRVRTLESND